MWQRKVKTSYRETFVKKGLFITLAPIIISVYSVCIIASCGSSGIQLANSIKIRAESTMVIEECFGNTLFRGFHELGDRFRKQASPVNHYLRRDRLSQSYGKSATTVKKIIDACTLLEEKLELRSRSMRTITFYSDVERIKLQTRC